jgi:Sec-independent protein secretion pathway component TatC
VPQPLALGANFEPTTVVVKAVGIIGALVILLVFAVLFVRCVGRKRKHVIETKIVIELQKLTK